MLLLRQAIVTDISWYRIEALKDNGAEGVTIVIVGNKSDLTDDRVISAEEAQKYAASVGIGYIETSPKENTNVKEAFEALYSKMKIGQVESEAAKPESAKSESGPEETGSPEEKKKNCCRLFWRRLPVYCDIMTFNYATRYVT